LPKEKADEYRAQARRLREKLDGYLSEHPNFTLKKILLAGSLGAIDIASQRPDRYVIEIPENKRKKVDG
jgi:hypothetical protein